MGARVIKSTTERSELQREPIVLFSLLFGFLLFLGIAGSVVWYFLPQRNLEAGAQFYIEEEYFAAQESLTRALSFGLLDEQDTARAFYLRGISNWELHNSVVAHNDLTAALDSTYLNRDEISAARFVRGKIWYDYEYYEEALEDYDVALASAFAESNDEGSTYLSRGWAHRKLDHQELALDDYAKAIKLLTEPSWAIEVHAGFAARLERRDLVAEDVLLMAREYPGFLDDLDLRLVFSAFGWLEENGSPGLAVELGQAILDADYIGPDPGDLPDYMFRDVVTAAMKSGDEQLARRAFGRVNLSHALLGMYVDREFEDLWSEDWFLLKAEPARGPELEAAYLRKLLADYPDRLSVLAQAVNSIRDTDPQEAIRIAEEAYERIDDFQGDNDDHHWFGNHYVYALVEGGRLDDAFRVMDEVVAPGLEGGPSLVNQFINFGEIYLDHGYFDEAIDMAHRAEGEGSSVNAYGRKWIRSVEVCAFAATDRRAEAIDIAVTMRESASENYAAVIKSFLCLERLDDVISLVIERLQDPLHRRAALLGLQTYIEAGEPDDTLARTLRRRMYMARDRAEVLQAINKVGRIVDVP